MAELGVPYILMHMRGDPATMQSRENTSYVDVCTDVGRELQAAANAAMSSGIEPWRLILDPGGLSPLDILRTDLPGRKPCHLHTSVRIVQTSLGTAQQC